MDDKINSDYFYWHCEVAALVLNTLPGNPATKHHVRNALRMATLAATGPKGVGFASERAHQTKALSAKNWDKCGLIREHVIPIGEVYEKVFRSLAFPIIHNDLGKPPGFMPVSEGRIKLRAGQSTLALGNPRPWQIAQILQQWTLLAYITKEEDQLLRERKLHDRMPAGWDGQDKFSRYSECGIVWKPIE
ncbi:hypothetical protein [Stenotrophomonas sp. PS02298]|uniref:hypothetical protein n=1 Tax=Stenotrophomonas sp. PS02298 TaxID=2991424 RepID=UPI00249A4122|nr:hypothetical protein [Stenotrophomonas sp. PS02298]